MGTAMPELLLVCEGEPTSLDVRVIELALKPLRASAHIRVYPAGDAKGRGLLCDALGIPSSHALEIKDRDFLPPSPALVLSPRKMRWRRHEIENFLLDPGVVLAALTKLRALADPPTWLSSAPSSRADVVALLKDIARPLLPRHVGGLVASELTRRCTHDNPTTFRRPNPVSDTADEWAASLTEEARRVLAGCGALASAPDLDPQTLDARYRGRLGELETSDFLASERFLLDMEGKRLRDGLLHALRALGAVHLTKDDLDTVLLEGLSLLLGGGPGLVPDDFSELRAEVLRVHQALLPVMPT